MQLLKDIVIDFCLFGLFEGIVYYYFIINIYNCNKNKYIPLLIGILNSIVTNIFPPILYHIIAIFYLRLLLSKLNCINIIKGIQKSFYMILAISILEMIISMFTEIILNIDLYTKNINYQILILFSIFAKLIEIIIINIFNKIKRRCN